MERPRRRPPPGRSWGSAGRSGRGQLLVSLPGAPPAPWPHRSRKMTVTAARRRHHSAAGTRGRKESQRSRGTYRQAPRRHAGSLSPEGQPGGQGRNSARARRFTGAKAPSSLPGTTAPGMPLGRPHRPPFSRQPLRGAERRGARAPYAAAAERAVGGDPGGGAAAPVFVTASGRAGTARCGRAPATGLARGGKGRGEWVRCRCCPR